MQNNSSDEDIVQESQSILNFPPVPTSRKTAEHQPESSQTCSFTISPEAVNSVSEKYEVVAEGACVSSNNSSAKNESDIQKEILKVVLHNRFSLREHSETLSSLMTNFNILFEKLQTGSRVQSEVNFPVSLPLTSLEDLQTLEEFLKDEDMQEYLVLFVEIPLSASPQITILKWSLKIG